MTTLTEHKSAFLLTLFLSVVLLAHPQSLTLDFEKGHTYPSFISNINTIADSSAYEGSQVCLCDSTNTYGLGFEIDPAKAYPRQNIGISYGIWFKTADTLSQAKIVFSIDGPNGNAFWHAYDLKTYQNGVDQWSSLQLNLHFPLDYLIGNTIKGYIWNPSHSRILIDYATIEIKGETPPSHQPEAEMGKHFITPFVEYINEQGDTLTDPSIITSLENISVNDEGRIAFKTQTTFHTNVKLLRLAYLMRMPEGKLTIYRRNQCIDTNDYQKSYYLDREGFLIESDSTIYATYHNLGISSLQIDTEQRSICFNIDYWRDHPLIHYPLVNDSLNYFEDISYRIVKEGETIEGSFDIYTNHSTKELPRIMPLWEGYESAFIFTEHADWTDLDTHRAVLFGNANITKPEDAVGGFTFFDIPVTKSVFYNNPDQITNKETSKGIFDSPIETIKTDKAFLKLLKSLKHNNFDICLHTPEIYTTARANLKEALRYMRRTFNSPSWIDHGYNNTSIHNRENLVCDGLLPHSPHYAVELWKRNKVKYLWNAYYEERNLAAYCFDNHFTQPYDGFGDAIPNRQITTLPNDCGFLLWATPSTLEINQDHEWYYYFDKKRLQHLIDHHTVFITHTYPAWCDSWRGFWEFNENGTPVAMPGFNYALQQLDSLRTTKQMLPTTISQYLSYHEKLLKISYEIQADGSIHIINNGDAIEGLTLVCQRPIVVEDKPIDFRKAGDEYLVWFNLNKHETATIRFRE